MALSAEEIQKIQAMPDGPFKVAAMTYLQKTQPPAGAAAPPPVSPPAGPPMSTPAANPWSTMAPLAFAGAPPAPAPAPTGTLDKLFPERGLAAPPFAGPAAAAGPAAPAPSSTFAVGDEAVSDAIPAGMKPQAALPPMPISVPKPMGGGGMGGPAVPKGPRDYIGEAFGPQEKGLYGEQIALTGDVGAAHAATAEAASEAALSKSVLLRNAQEDAENMAAKFEENEAKRQAFMQHALDLHEKESADLAKLKVDPDHYWESKSTGGKIFSIIGMVLGGAGGAGTGGVNMAAKMFQDQIDKDIAIQKDNIVGKYKALEGKRTILGDRLKLFGDERMAELSTRAEFWKSIETKASAIGASFESTAAKSKIDEIVALAGLQQNQLKQGILGLAKQIVTQKDAAQAAAMTAARKKLEERDNKIVDANLDAQKKWLAEVQIPGAKIVPGADGMPIVVAPKMGPDGPALDANGQQVWQHIVPSGGAAGGGSVNVPVGVNADNKVMWGTATAPNGPAAKELSEKAAAVGDLLGSLGDLQKAAAMPGPWVGEKKKLYDAAHTSAIAQKNKTLKLGALDVKTQEMLEKAIPKSPTWGVGYLSDGQLAQIHSATAEALESMGNTVNAYTKAKPQNPLPLVKPKE